MEPMARRVFKDPTEGRWPLCWSQADCSADAGGGDRGRQPAQKGADHNAAGGRVSSRQRSRPSQLHGRAAERVVGGRHHLPADVGRLSLPCDLLDAWSRRIVGWAFSADLKTRIVLDALDMAIVARKPTTSSIT